MTYGRGHRGQTVRWRRLRCWWRDRREPWQHGWVRAVAIAVVVCVVGLGVLPQRAIAEVRQQVEAPGQVLYQSRQSLRDRDGRTWQLILFHRVVAPDADFSAIAPDPDAPAIPHQNTTQLRLTGFPDLVTLDRTRPLEINPLLGEPMVATDTSAKALDEPDRDRHIGQWQVVRVLEQLPSVMPLTLAVPVIDAQGGAGSITLDVPAYVVREWQSVAQNNDTEV